MAREHGTATSTMDRPKARWTRVGLLLAALLLVCLLVAPLLPVVIPGGVRMGGWIAAAEVYAEANPLPRWQGFRFYQRPLEAEPLPGAAAGRPLPWSEGRECQFRAWWWTYRLMLSRQQ